MYVGYDEVERIHFIECPKRGVSGQFMVHRAVHRPEYGRYRCGDFRIVFDQQHRYSGGRSSMLRWDDDNLGVDDLTPITRKVEAQRRPRLWDAIDARGTASLLARS